MSTPLNCQCDAFQFPPATAIRAGLTRLTRQTGTFAEFRRALLRAASVRRTTSALADNPIWQLRYLLEPDRSGLELSLDAISRWRGRHPEDFGIMLLEMWAYVCDLISFYDEVLAHESYVRTARRRDSLRKLVALLGYVPRPAVAALAELVALAEGRQVVTLPGGTAFRSDAFQGNPPQIFELTTATTIHPLLNEWSLLPVRPVNLTSQEFLLCRPGTVSVKADDLVVVKLGSSLQPRRVREVSDYTGADGENYVQVTFNESLSVPAGTPYSSVRLLKPAAVASPWMLGLDSGTVLSDYLYLDSINRQIRTGQTVVLERTGEFQAMTVDSIVDSNRILVAATTVTYTPAGGTETTVNIPAVRAPVSLITFTENINTTIAAARTEIIVHYGLTEAGVVIAEAMTEIDQDDVLVVRTPIERPRDSSPPGRFQFEDKNNNGLARSGTLNFATGRLTPQGNPWPNSLVPPVKLFGNCIATSRGETVTGEVLGTGNAAIPNQSFTLKKSPLTYLPTPSERTPSGLTSTLKLYVDGLQWSEVPSFYGRAPEDEVYVVRENDKNETMVTFGDGVRGRRLSTGAVVTANYRYGAGAAMPPAGGITQIAKAVKGLKSVRSPVAPFGGADAEPAGSLQKFAPRSSLLLGRAVSLADLEAAAVSYSGVRAVAAEWRWSSQLQVPAAHIWYLADGDLTELITNRLKMLTHPNTPIQVERAMPFSRQLSVQLTIDPKRLEADVLLATRRALMNTETGLLPPERLGIGKSLFRSRVFEFLTNVSGVSSVNGLNLDSTPFSSYGVRPPAGRYFDFTVFLNGRSE